MSKQRKLKKFRNWESWGSWSDPELIVNSEKSHVEVQLQSNRKVESNFYKFNLTDFSANNEEYLEDFFDAENMVENHAIGIMKKLLVMAKKRRAAAAFLQNFFN